jgi:hypothetical protein
MVARSASRKPGLPLLAREFSMNFVALARCFLAGALLLTSTAAGYAPPPRAGVPFAPGLARPGRSATAAAQRVVFYYQTQYYNGQYISLEPMWTHLDPQTHLPIVTDVMIAAVHLGFNANNTPYIHINDNEPGAKMFDVMWPQVATLQKAGVSARFMLGGAAQGSYALLFSQPHVFYPILRDTLAKYHLNGIDLDVEETVTLEHIESLIARLRADFGPSFIITLSPVASDLTEGFGLSGFSYKALYHSSVGPDIAWFNTQFYSGFGSLDSPSDYETAVKNGFAPDKIVGGTLTNPDNGSGFVDITLLQSVVHQLSTRYPTFGGVAGWEYFDSLPGGLTHPFEFALRMAQALK